jgi:hypothetical protein
MLKPSGYSCYTRVASILDEVDAVHPRAVGGLHALKGTVELLERKIECLRRAIGPRRPRSGCCSA